MLGHFEELSYRLRRAIVLVVVFSFVAYVYSSELIYILQKPLLDKLAGQQGELVFTAFFEKIWAYIKVSLIVGFGAALPMVFWEVAQFVGPGLKKNEGRRIKYLSVWVGLAFVLGIVCGYFFTLPKVIDAVLRFGGGHELPFFTLSSYVNTSLGLLLITALMMEIPVLMFHLTLWGWVSNKQWRQWRKISIIVNALLSAILSPPDAISMFIVLVPLQILYEAGILSSYVAKWFRYEKTTADTVPSAS